MNWVRALNEELAGHLETARSYVLSRLEEDDPGERIGALLQLACLEERMGQPLEAAEWYARAGRELVNAHDPLAPDGGFPLDTLIAALDAFHMGVCCASGDDSLQHAIAQEYIPVFEEVWTVAPADLAREAVFAGLLAERLGDPERAVAYFEGAALGLEEEAVRERNPLAAVIAAEAWEACARGLERLGQREEAERVRNFAHMPLHR